VEAPLQSSPRGRDHFPAVRGGGAGRHARRPICSRAGLAALIPPAASSAAYLGWGYMRKGLSFPAARRGPQDAPTGFGPASVARCAPTRQNLCTAFLRRVRLARPLQGETPWALSDPTAVTVSARCQNRDHRPGSRRRSRASPPGKTRERWRDVPVVSHGSNPRGAPAQQSFPRWRVADRRRIARATDRQQPHVANLGRQLSNEVSGLPSRCCAAARQSQRPTRRP
jgi:hypothetical protein